MAASDLAALQDVKDWLAAGGPALGSSDDKVLARMITAVSGAVYAYLSRQIIIPQQVTERYDGVGNPRILLRNYPVLSVSSILVNGTNYPLGTYPTSSSPGWPPANALVAPWDGLLPGKPQILDAYGAINGAANGATYGFSWGRQNVQVVYTAGYQVTAEAASIPATPGPYTCTVAAPLGPWANDQGVFYAATGAALTSVKALTGAGQYIPPAAGVASETTGAVYTFDSLDQGEAILISYGFIPAALNNACIEWVAERYRYRGRIGQRSQTVSGQQTASYDLSAVPAFIKGTLDPYRCVVPFIYPGS